MAQEIQTLMTTDPVTVDADAALIDAATAMHDRDVGAVVVTDRGGVVGIVTDRDITIRGTARGADPTSTTVGDVCSRELTTVTPDQTVDDVLAIMRDRKLRRVPVVSAGHPVGIVALGDLAVTRDRASVLGEISAADPNR
jgi:CBS domain-containing protein